MNRKFLIFLYVFQICIFAETPDRKLAGNSEEVFKSLFKFITTFYKQKFEDDDFKIKKEPDNINKLQKGFKLSFGTEQNKNFIIEAKQNKNKPKTIDLFLTNPIEKMTLELSHYNLRDTTDQDLIEEKFLNRFFSRIDQFEFEPTTIMQESAKIIQENMKIKFDQLDGDEEEDINDEYPISKSFYFAIINTSANYGNDLLQRDLKITITIDEQQQMSVQSQFFNGQFKILAPTKEFLETTLTPIIEQIRDHYERYLLFNRYDDQEGNKEKQFEIDFIFDSFEKVNIKKDFKFSFMEEQEDPPKGYIQFQFKDDLTMKPEANKVIYEVIQNDEEFIYVLKATLKDYINGKDKEFSISILQESVYNLTAVVDSFWEKVMNLMIIKYAPSDYKNIKMFTDN